MMSTKDLQPILAAYQKGMTADMLQAKIDGEWGVFWTVPPCSPEAMARAGHKFLRTRAQQVRHIRRARLNCGGCLAHDAIIITVLPDRRQKVISLDCGEDLAIKGYLEDESLAALAMTFANGTVAG